MRRLTTILLAALAILALLVTPVAAAPPDLPGMPEMMAQMERDTAELRGLAGRDFEIAYMQKMRGLAGRDFEIAYMQKMRGHHLAAIEMARLVPSRATHPELRAFAQRVIADQQQEVAQLEGWLTAWYGIDKPMDMPMAGMDRMMPALMALSGADFEQAWLMMMVHHHMGAVDMSALAPGRATHPELLQLAGNIITNQGKEIEQLRGWAQAWYGFDPMPMNHGGMPMPGLPNTGAGGGRRDMTALLVGAALAVALAAVPLSFVLRRRVARGAR